jgi:reductive dehalogenase
VSRPDPSHANARVDERDTMFARMERRAGTPAYEDYYGRNPQSQAVDDRLRTMPGLCEPGGLHYDPATAAQTQAYFEAIGEIRPDPKVVGLWAERLRTAADPTPVIRTMFTELGAVAAGFTALHPSCVYTHKGRFDRHYGREVALDHPSACVFLVEMDLAAMRQAPKAATIRESAHQYHRAAEISLVAAAALEAAGFEAKAQYDARYDVILPPLAVHAGLGELGRNNILIADRFGSRVRIGAVTTNAPVRHDRPRVLGAARFCEVCLKCADNCPSHALSKGPRENVRGVAKWPTRVERCHAYWRRVGTDCGVCMASCPFSHADNAFHRAVRFLVRRLPLLHRLLKWCDDVFYGRTWKPR